MMHTGELHAPETLDAMAVAIVGVMVGLYMAALGLACLWNWMQVVDQPSWAEWEARDSAKPYTFSVSLEPVFSKDGHWIWPQEFEEAVATALADMPPEVQRDLARSVVTIAMRATPEQLEATHCSVLAGYWARAPVIAGAVRVSDLTAAPGELCIFMEHVVSTHDRDDLVRGVAQLVQHEVGHAVGLGHEQLAELGV